ncbi:KH domain-containing protein [Patescibacteria group bacterium]|nr:KH domain-containing protein [Patescibacteria group bacterium]
MKELVEFLTKNIVSEDSKVKVEESTSESGQIINFSVAPEDMGKIIGKSGRVIRALRTILKIKAIKEGKRVYLDLEDQR